MAPFQPGLYLCETVLPQSCKYLSYISTQAFLPQIWMTPVDLPLGGEEGVDPITDRVRLAASQGRHVLLRRKSQGEVLLAGCNSCQRGRQNANSLRGRSAGRRVGNAPEGTSADDFNLGAHRTGSRASHSHGKGVFRDQGGGGWLGLSTLVLLIITNRDLTGHHDRYSRCSRTGSWVRHQGT